MEYEVKFFLLCKDIRKSNYDLVKKMKGRIYIHCRDNVYKLDKTIKFDAVLFFFKVKDDAAV